MEFLGVEEMADKLLAMSKTEEWNKDGIRPRLMTIYMNGYSECLSDRQKSGGGINYQKPT